MTDDMTMGEISRTLNRMEERLERVVDDHEGRLRRLERWSYALPPTIVTAGAGLLLAWRS